jgi:hypothetical protein
LAGLAVVWSSGCASASGGAGGGREGWLRGNGFRGRGDWSSAVLHLDQGELGPSRRFAEILRQVPGIRVRPRPGNLWGVERLGVPSGAPCPVSVYLNGSRLVQSAPQARVSLDALISAPSLDGLELHLGPDGPLWEADGCGSLLLWAWDRRGPDDQPFRGSIRGRIRSVRPDTAVAVRVRRARSGRPGESAAADTTLHLDSEGAFALEGLLPGPYRLEILGPEGAPAASRVLGRQDLRIYAFRESLLETHVIRRR